MWKLATDKKVKRRDKLVTLCDFDQALGLNLAAAAKPLGLSLKIKQLVAARITARQNRDWSSADKLRQEIEKLGYRLEDTSAGLKIKE